MATKVSLVVASHKGSYDHYWHTDFAAPTQEQAQRQIENDRKKERESHRELKKFAKGKLSRRSPTRRKIERLSAKFSGKVFLCASVDWPDGWMPKHCLDLPRKLNTGTWGHELWLREEESNLSVTREAVIAEVVEKNCEEMSRTPGPGDRPFYWSCIVEVGEVFGDGLGVFKIIDGVGLLDIAHCNRVIRVVKTTPAEIEKYSQPSKRKVVA